MRGCTSEYSCKASEAVLNVVYMFVIIVPSYFWNHGMCAVVIAKIQCTCSMDAIEVISMKATSLIDV